MNPLDPKLKAVGGARTGIAPVNLLDILDVNGNIYLWSDRKIVAPPVIAPSVSTMRVPGEAIYGGSTVNPPPSASDLGITLAPNEGIAWGFPATSGPDGNTGHYTIDNQTYGRLDWGGFVFPALPSGATIENYRFGRSCRYVVVASLDDAGDTPSDGYRVTELSCSGVPANCSSQIFTGACGFDEAYAPPGMDPLRSFEGDSVYIFSRDSHGPPFKSVGSVAVSFVGIAIIFAMPASPSAWGVSRAIGTIETGMTQYAPWLLSVPQFSFHRSLQTITGSFVVQNLSGDTLSRDFEKLARLSALEGAFFVWRCWQADAQAAWVEVHGTLTVGEIGVDTVELKAKGIDAPGEWDAVEIYSETCQLQWGGRRCGSTQATECGYSFQTCQVPERIMVALNHYEKNFGEATAATALNVINRRRAI